MIGQETAGDPIYELAYAIVERAVLDWGICSRREDKRKRGAAHNAKISKREISAFMHSKWCARLMQDDEAPKRILSAMQHKSTSMKNGMGRPINPFAKCHEKERRKALREQQKARQS